MRLVRPPRLVEVSVDDIWRQGFLEAWRRDGDSWLAYVRYAVGPGMRRLTWLPAQRVRPVWGLTRADGRGQATRCARD
jgi:hypothetical protein